MTSYVVKRLAWMLPVLWAAATLVWVFMFLIPGDPARILSGQSSDPEVLAAVRAEWGLDRPALARYGEFLGRLARLDLGTSYVRHRPVAEIVADGMWRTLFLAVTATALGTAIGIGFGAISAARKGTLLDGMVLAVTTTGITLPTFWLGLLLRLVFVSWLGWFPPSGYGEGVWVLGLKLPDPANLVLPSLTLAIFSSGYLARVTRASLIEESSQEYVRATMARGASATGAMMRHALPNSLLPVVTLTGLSFGQLLGGAIVTETIFNWPGLGSVITSALRSRDLPVVEGGVLAATAAFLLVNLAVDLSYAVIDPRIRD